MLASEVITEEWLVDVLDDSMEMDWTTADGARAIMRALDAGLVRLPQTGGQIASLASAPAGDGEMQRILRQLDEAQAWTGNHEDGQDDPFQDQQQLLLDAAALIRSLDRPRAAVGEQSREAIARLIWEDRYPTGTNWDDWERHIAANGGFDGRDSCRKLADAILALQCPPAKVEG